MTDTPFSPPSQSQSSIGDLAGTINFILTKFLQKTDDMLPATIIAYDQATNRATVQPVVQIVTTDNKRISRAQISSVPVLQIGAGGFAMVWPVKEGDLGWIKANDSDISLFLQSLQESPPNTARLHTFENAMFIPDSMMRQVVIDPSETNDVVLQSIDGTVRIALGETGVKITAPLLTINAAHVNVSGNITAVGDIIAGTVSLKTHTHKGVTTGTGNTGVPN